MSCISIKLDLIKGSGSGFRICQCILPFPQTSRPSCFRFQCWVGYTMTIERQHTR
jgi:hypothetical protein